MDTYVALCDMCSKNVPCQDIAMDYEHGATICADCAELIAWDIRNDVKNAEVKVDEPI